MIYLKVVISNAAAVFSLLFTIPPRGLISSVQDFDIMLTDIQQLEGLGDLINIRWLL